MNLIAQSTQAIDSPLPAWAVTGLAALTIINVYFWPRLLRMYGEFEKNRAEAVEAGRLAAEAKAQADRNAAKLDDVQKTASEAKGAADSANVTATAAALQTIPQQPSKALPEAGGKESNGMNP